MGAVDHGDPARRGHEHLPIDPDLGPRDPAEPASTHIPRAADAPPPHRADPAVLAAIALGGALGAPARYAVAELVGSGEGGFPWATLWTNVAGSLALGFVLVVVLRRFPASRYLRPFVATGFLGAFTTFSTFAVETSRLIDHGHLATAVSYVTASIVVGIGASALGIAGGRLVPVAERPG